MANTQEENIGDRLAYYIDAVSQSCLAILSCTTSQANQI